MEENDNYGYAVVCRNVHVHVRMHAAFALCTCMHACSICADLHVYVYLHGILISCFLVACIYKMFHHTETYYFIAAKQDLRGC